MNYKITKELRDSLVDLLKGIKGNIGLEVTLLGFAAKLEQLEEIKETNENNTKTTS